LGKLDFSQTKERIKEVKDAFYNMYDAVVGHSYVPDMVDGISYHFGRLQAEMVEPVKKGTEAAKQAFDQMKQSVLSVLERLFPEEARYTTYINELKLITQNMEKLGFTAEQVAAAVAKLSKEFEKDVFGEEEPGWWTKSTDVSNDNEPVGPLGGSGDVMDDIEKQNEITLDKIGDLTRNKTAEMAMMWVDMAGMAVDALRGMVDSFKSGDILGGIQEMIYVIGDVLRMLGQAGIIKGSWGNPGASGGTSAPGYSTGGSFQVGGSGGVDSQLVQFRATPGEQVRVDRTADQGRREPVVVVVTKGEMFDAHVERAARPMVEEGVQRGAVGGAMLAARQNHRARRGALA
jgi:hypothetical protein